MIQKPDMNSGPSLSGPGPTTFAPLRLSMSFELRGASTPPAASRIRQNQAIEAGCLGGGGIRDLRVASVDRSRGDHLPIDQVRRGLKHDRTVGWALQPQSESLGGCTQSGQFQVGSNDLGSGSKDLQAVVRHLPSVAADRIPDSELPIATS